MKENLKRENEKIWNKKTENMFQSIFRISRKTEYELLKIFCWMENELL